MLSPQAGRGENKLSVRIGIHHRAPAGTVEWLPLAFALREAVGDRVDHGGVMTHAAMAAFDLDAFGLRRGLLNAALPGANAVGAAEDRGGRHRWRDGERSAEARILLVGAAAARDLVDAPGIGRAWRSGERAAERDHAAH